MRWLLLWTPMAISSPDVCRKCLITLRACKGLEMNKGKKLLQHNQVVIRKSQAIGIHKKKSGVCHSSSFFTGFFKHLFALIDSCYQGVRWTELHISFSPDSYFQYLRFQIWKSSFSPWLIRLYENIISKEYYWNTIFQFLFFQTYFVN